MLTPDNIIILGKKDLIPESSFWITRDGSVLGNPFRKGKDGTKAEVIEKYRKYLFREIRLKTDVYDRLMQLVELYKSGEKVRLRCVCKPAACHGDVVKEAIIYLASRSKPFEFEIDDD